MSLPTVIVPTSSNLEGLNRALESISAGGIEYAVVVADNGSRDGAASRIAAEHGAEAIRFERNYGYSRAVNVAAREAGPGPLVLVNDDCVLDPGFVEAITAPLDPAAGVVMVAGALRENGDRSRIDSAGIEYDRTLLAFDYLNGEPVAALAGAPPPVGPSAAAAAFDRDAFLSVGGFDEHLFAYWEDVDLVVRMRLAGGRCELARDAVGTHAHSATLGTGSAAKNRLMGFGRGYLLRKWGVISGRRMAAIAARELTLIAGQAVLDRTLAGAWGRLDGWQSAEPGSYPAEELQGAEASGLVETMRRRLARRRRLTHSPQAAH